MISSVCCWRTLLQISSSLLILPTPTTYLISGRRPKSEISTPKVYFPATVSETLSSYGNDWKRALDFFNWVENECDFTHTTDTYNRMVDILGKFFEYDLSWDLIGRMKRSSCAMPDHATFRIMFKRYISAHMVNDAVCCFDRLDEFNLKDETSYYNLIDALCEYKHVTEAHDFCFGKNHDRGRDGILQSLMKRTKIYNMILRGWSKVGWWGKCKEFWEEMDKIGVRKDLHSYSIYMDILCKSRKPWKAVQLYKEMQVRGIKLDVVAYNTVVQATGLSEGVDFALRVCHQMKESGCNPNVATCNIVVKLLCDHGRVRDAYKMLHEMPKNGVEPNVITYQCFFASLEKPEEILWMFDRMVANGIRPRMETFVMLMRKFGRWGFLRPIFMLWKKMEELKCSPDDSAYNALIDALIQKGMFDMAKRYDEEMLAKGLSAKPRVELAVKLID